LADYSIGYCGGKGVHMNMCLILNGYGKKAVCISRPNSVRVFYKIKVETRDKFLTRILMINSTEQHSSFAHDLQSTLRLTVEFSIIYCEL